MKATTILARTFLEMLDRKTYDDIVARFKISKRNRESQLRFLSRVEFVGFILRDFEVSPHTLLKVAKALEINTGRLRSADSLARHIAGAIALLGNAIRTGRPISEVNTSPNAELEQQDWDKDYGGYKLSHLWAAAEELAVPIVLLKSRKSETSTKTPIAFWNTSLSRKRKAGIWIRTDLSRHPNHKLRSKGILSVNVDPSTLKTFTSFQIGAKLTRQKGEKPLFGEHEFDFPEANLLIAKTDSKTKLAIEQHPESIKDYERQWWSDYRPCDVYDGTKVYAQLGGLPFGWPAYSVDFSHFDRIVLRTYRDAEPWLEVWKTRTSYSSRGYVT